jgi:hypothetical protein
MVRNFAKTLLGAALLAVAATSGEAGNPAVQVPLMTPTPSPSVTTAAPISMGALTPTPASSPPKKKKKKGKKCASGLEAMPEDAAAEAASEAAIAASIANNTPAAALSATRDNEPLAAPALAPAVPVGGVSAASSANTKSGGVQTDGVGGGVVAAVVVAGVMIVGVAAVAVRRGAEERRRADTLRTPVENFGVIGRTPGNVTVL